ncbi:hypothetical protein Tco_0447707, partial [Tanacetum coccineum]
MAGLLCNKFKGGKDKVMLVKDTWLGNALSLKGQGMMHGLRKKAMLAKAQESGQTLDEEQLEFLTDPGILDGQ